MKKNKITSIILASINLAVCLSLLIFLTPNQVPLLAGLHDKIIIIGSKWWLILGIIIPIILLIPVILSKSKYIQLLFTELIIFVVYNNMLGFSYFCTEKTFAVGMVSKIPLSISIFLPLALWIFIYGVAIKNIPYKNKFGICTKYTQTTEFIWKQTHITASYHFRLWGLILFIISIIFTFLHLPLTELVIFIICISIPFIYLQDQAKKMTKKYQDMKAKQDTIKKK